MSTKELGLLVLGFLAAYAALWGALDLWVDAKRKESMRRVPIKSKGVDRCRDMRELKTPFKVGQPVPKVWLHMELSYADTMLYLGNAVIPTQEEADRLTERYFNVDGGTGI